MNGRLEIKAFSIGLPDVAEDQIPDDIQWMPPGEHEITPSVEGNDEPSTFKVRVNAELVPLLVASLDEVRAGGVQPYIDFNHNSDLGASGWVKSLYWGGDDPVTGGIRAKIDWSVAGRKALAGKTFKRFSPRFFVDSKNGHRIVGTGTNAGGLVNEPAFKKITPIVAKHGGEGGEKPKPEQNEEGMTEEEKKKMEALEARVAEQAEQLEEAKKAKKAMEDKVNEHEKQAKAAKEAKGRELLDLAVECGIVEPKNEDKKKEFLAMATEHPVGAIMAIDAAAGAKAQLEQRVTPQGKDRQEKPDDEAEFKIASAYQAKHGGTFVQAWAATAKERSEAVAVA